MHRRMKLLVDQAKSITEHNTKRQELVGIRWVVKSAAQVELTASLVH